MTTSSQAIEQGYLKVASGGEQGQAAFREQHPHRKQLLHWHASIAKNTAAEFAVAQELQRGTNLRDIFLCNLDGDNIMFPNFPTSLVAQTGPWSDILNSELMHNSCLFYHPLCHHWNTSLSSSTPSCLVFSALVLSSVPSLWFFVFQRLLSQFLLHFCNRRYHLPDCNFLKGPCLSDAFVFQGIIDQETFGTEEEIHFRPPVFAQWAGATTGRIGWQTQPHKVESAQSVCFVILLSLVIGNMDRNRTCLGSWALGLVVILQ